MSFVWQEIYRKRISVFEGLKLVDVVTFEVTLRKTRTEKKVHMNL